MNESERFSELKAQLLIPTHSLSITGEGISWTGEGVLSVLDTGPDVELWSRPNPIRAPWSYRTSIATLVNYHDAKADNLLFPMNLIMRHQLDKYGKTQHHPIVDEVETFDPYQIYDREQARYHEWLSLVIAAAEHLLIEEAKQ